MLNLCSKLTNLTLKRLQSSLANNVLEQLNERTLLRVAGTDVANFLQGLITNDIDRLNMGTGSMYTMFLNSKGRILYDSIIYRDSEKDKYLIECDKRVSENLQKHLKVYRVRRKIDISSLHDEFNLYVLFDNNLQKSGSGNGFDQNLVESKFFSQKLNDPLSQISKNIDQDFMIYCDPRINNLGSRIIARKDINVNDHLSKIIRFEVNPDNKQNYRWLRYCFGIGEGIDDLPPGESFPLECNCDYLHAVSFHKGCYVGQELTARIHHTGVVRKRLMPIQFTKIPSKPLDEKIVHENVNLGKFRGIENNVGLALLRISKALTFKNIQFGDGIGITFKPHWWPCELSKEKMSLHDLH